MSKNSGTSEFEAEDVDAAAPCATNSRNDTMIFTDDYRLESEDDWKYLFEVSLAVG